MKIHNLDAISSFYQLKNESSQITIEMLGNDANYILKGLPNIRFVSILTPECPNTVFKKIESEHHNASS
jgi:hypothetical protein